MVAFAVCFGSCDAEDDCDFIGSDDEYAECVSECDEHLDDAFDESDDCFDALDDLYDCTADTDLTCDELDLVFEEDETDANPCLEEYDDYLDSCSADITGE